MVGEARRRLNDTETKTLFGQYIELDWASPRAKKKEDKSSSCIRSLTRVVVGAFFCSGPLSLSLCIRHVSTEAYIYSPKSPHDTFIFYIDDSNCTAQRWHQLFDNKKGLAAVTETIIYVLHHIIPNLLLPFSCLGLSATSVCSNLTVRALDNTFVVSFPHKHEHKEMVIWWIGMVAKQGLATISISTSNKLYRKKKKDPCIWCCSLSKSI